MSHMVRVPDGKGGTKEITKKSGAEWKKIKKKGHPLQDEPYIWGWRKTTAGLMNYSCMPFKGKNGKKGSRTVKAKSGESKGHESIVWVCLPFNVTMRMKGQACTAFYNPTKHQVTVPDLGLVLNPDAPRGGYCGPWRKKEDKE